LKLSPYPSYVHVLIDGICRFVSHIIEEIDKNIRITIETRGSSIFKGRIPQLIYDCRYLKDVIVKIVDFLKCYKIDVGFTADPWQEHHI